MLPDVTFIINEGIEHIIKLTNSKTKHCFIKYKYNGYAQPKCNSSLN